MNEICPQCQDSRVIWSWNKCPRCGFDFTSGPNLEAPKSGKRHLPILSSIALLISLLSAIIGFTIYTTKWHSSDSWGWGIIGAYILFVLFPAPITLLLSIASFIRRERPIILSVISSLIGAVLTFQLLRISTS